MTVTDDLAYGITNLRVGGSGAHMPHVRVHCGNCTNRLEFPCNHSRPPEMIAKAIRHKGWEFDLYNRRRSRCPECIKLHTAARQGESPGAKRFVDLFGQKVALPVNIVPEDAMASEPAPSPPPKPKASEPAPPPPPPPSPPSPPREPKRPVPSVAQEVERPKRPREILTGDAELIATFPARTKRVVREYRIELRTDRPFVDLASVLSGVGDVTALVVTATGHDIEKHIAQPLQIPQKPPTPKRTPAVAPATPTPKHGLYGPKSPTHRTAIGAAMRARATEHNAKVRSALDEIRRTAPNGRQPRIDEYIRELKAMGLKPYSRAVWSDANVRKHLAALDNASL